MKSRMNWRDLRELRYRTRPKVCAGCNCAHRGKCSTERAGVGVAETASAVDSRGESYSPGPRATPPTPDDPK